MSPACGCKQSVRRKRLLSEAAADGWPHSGLAEIPSIAHVNTFGRRSGVGLGLECLLMVLLQCRRQQAYWRYRYAPHGVSLWIVAQQSGDPRHQVWIGVVEGGPCLLNL
jgi:hypothetical protein